MSNKRKQRTLTDKEFLELMRKKKGKTFLKDFAKQFRVSFQFLGKVLAGKCGPGPKIAKALGYQQQTIFVAVAPKAKKVKKAKKKHIAVGFEKMPAAAKVKAAAAK